MLDCSVLHSGAQVRPTHSRPDSPSKERITGPWPPRGRCGAQNTQPGMPPRGEAPCAFKDSMIRGCCRSHYVSQFAAFFIVAGAKVSIACSCDFVFQFSRFKHQLQSVVCERPPRILRENAGPAAPPSGAFRNIPRARARLHAQLRVIQLQVPLQSPCYDFSFL